MERRGWWLPLSTWDTLGTLLVMLDATCSLQALALFGFHKPSGWVWSRRLTAFTRGWSILIVPAPLEMPISPPIFPHPVFLHGLCGHTGQTSSQVSGLSFIIWTLTFGYSPGSAVSRFWIFHIAQDSQLIWSLFGEDTQMVSKYSRSPRGTRAPLRSGWFYLGQEGCRMGPQYLVKAENKEAVGTVRSYERLRCSTWRGSFWASEKKNTISVDRDP